MNSNLTGFNPTTVNVAINSVMTAYNEVVNAFGTQMQKNVVGFMADKWACNNAIDAFTEVKSSVDKLMQSIDSIFESVVASMSSAAESWAASTGTSYSGTKLSPYNQQLSIDAIKENIGGVRGIDLENTPTVYTNLTEISEKSIEAMDKAKEAVAESGFFDVTNMQQGSLDNSLHMIRNNITNAVNDITTSLRTAIEQTVSKYGDKKGEVSKAFAGSQAQ